MHWSHHSVCVCVCVCVCVADKLSPLNSPLQCGWLKITCHLLNSPLQCGWLKINCHILNSPLQCGWLKITCHLLKSPLQCGWLKITCHLLNSPLQCGWLTITFHLNTIQPCNWVTCEALGSSTCMQIECVITYHAMNTASCHIHRNLLHTLHILTHCACKHSIYTFSCRLFRESSKVCVPGLEIITRVKNLSCVYMTARVMETALRLS